MIGLSTGELPAPIATGNDILMDSYVKIRMQYVVSYPDPDNGGYYTRNHGCYFEYKRHSGFFGPRLP